MHSIRLRFSVSVGSVLSYLMLCLVSSFVLLLVGGASAFNHFRHSVSTSQIIHHLNYQLTLQPQTRYTRHSITMSSTTTSAETLADMSTVKRPFRIRTITCFVTLKPEDFQKQEANDVYTGLTTKINKCSDILLNLESSLSNIGYEVQTIRVATNPFGEWLTTQQLVDDNDSSKNDTSPPTQKKLKVDDVQERLKQFDSILESKNIQFCSLGPSLVPNDTINICPIIVATSGKFSCSAKINAGDIEASRAAAQCMKNISTLGDDEISADNSHIKGGLGNFRFCAASCIECVPFFPGARKADDSHAFSFAIGLENGGFACTLLEEAKNIGNIKHVFDTRMREELLPIQDVCMKFENDDQSVKYLGIDTSFNPSLDEGGSIAEAIERLEEVRGNFGGTGSLSAAAAITTSLQSIKDIKTTGYSGLMLPVLEDQRLAELANQDGLTIQQLLCISSVCGVGIDTVPIPGNVSEDNLSSLILDVAALACRWNKPLSCRVFPVPGKTAGEMTTFDSPYMVNSRIFEL